MEIGEYCKLSSCSTLTYLPVNCPYCRIRYCQSHFLPAQHDCKAPGAAEADRTLSDAEILKRIQRANERRREVQQGATHSIAAGILPPDDVNNVAGPSKLPCQKAGCKQYSLQLDPSTPQGTTQIDDGGGQRVNVIHKAPRCERCRGFFCMSHRSVQAHGCSAPAPPTVGDKRRDAANERKLKAQAILDKNFPNRNKNITVLDGISNYTKFWQKDSKNDTDTDQSNRLTEYTSVVNGYYDGATDLYEYGWGQNFHFARYYPGEAFYQAIARHEHYLAHSMGLKKKMRVLDVGCGVGGPAREIARFADVEVVGLNNNEYQLDRARKYTEKAGLSDQVTFVKGDFMKLREQFGENSFDAVYAIEATCHAPSWEGVYGEIKRVLKPGGIFGCYEWCMTDIWDAKNPQHKKVAHGIEVGDGIPEMRSIAAARSALKTVGFQIEHEEDLADRGDKIPWYYPLEGDLRKCQTVWDLFMCWRMTWVGKVTTQTTVKILERVGLAPKGTHDVGESLKVAADNLVEGGREKLFTPMMLFVCRKPEN